ncbi:MAG: hypothetical protein A4E38_01024 [Methanoregulaceae archaeon PtaB.Bin108]|nr:MAG: hypothetical protein A4E38_01024 [Methanoregulaceae archaeon PtaB.Bin108]OPY40020.1 MAG: hypothetical protein A4E42_02310 [Methanoregulaceae archaeon PtaU1.Bin222]
MVSPSSAALIASWMFVKLQPESQTVQVTAIDGAQKLSINTIPIRKKRETLKSPVLPDAPI